MDMEDWLWDFSTWGFSYLKQVLEPIPCGNGGTTANSGRISMSSNIFLQQWLLLGAPRKA